MSIGLGLILVVQGVALVTFDINTVGRNFIPQRDLTRYYYLTRDSSCNPTIVNQALCLPISHYLVRAWSCCLLRLQLEGAKEHERRVQTHLPELRQ